MIADSSGCETCPTVSCNSPVLICNDEHLMSSRNDDSNYVHVPRAIIGSNHTVSECWVSKPENVLSNENSSSCIDAREIDSLLVGEHVKDPTSFSGSYEPVDYEPGLKMFPDRLPNCHYVGGLRSQMNAQAWITELKYENDNWLKGYIRDGILNGFKIVDNLDEVCPYDRSNYSSALEGEAGEFVNELMEQEIRSGKYMLTTSRPKCIHSLGSVKKSGGGFRPITDCRQPLGESINNHMDTTAQSFKFMSVDHVQSLIYPDCFSCTIDISSAYRSISIYPPHRVLQGIRWSRNNSSCFLVDTRLCFGIKCAPFVFHQVSVFLARCMQRRGFSGICYYLDDFLCVGGGFSDCQYTQGVFIHLLHYLGFDVAWHKCSTPSKVTRYLGIDFDSSCMQLRIPPDKLDRLFKELVFFESKSRATLRQLQRLCGTLAYCSKLIRGGENFFPSDYFPFEKLERQDSCDFVSLF